MHLPPFQAAIDAGAGAVMSAFHDLNGVPCTMDPWLLTDILRKRMGFGGFVVSDAEAVKLTKKAEFGLFDREYRFRPEEIDRVMLSKEHRKNALEVGKRCAVLLKNDGLLPLLGKRKKFS